VTASLSPLLGVMQFERPPVSFENWNTLYILTFKFLQDAGGFAMIGIVLWSFYAVLNPVYDTSATGYRNNRNLSKWMLLPGAIALSLYLVSLGLMIMIGSDPIINEATATVVLFGGRITPMMRMFEIALALAGLFALIGFAGPFVADCFHMKWRRIYAIAKLSFKEAIRRKVVYVFLGILFLYLFPARWFFQEKLEDEIKTIVNVTTRGMNLLLISVGLLLASFSIPSDIKNLTIYTIVTKPVEKFEIVIGRFLGYLGLVTAALVLWTGFGLVIIGVGNVSDEAKAESMKARVANYGFLQFKHKTKGFEGAGIDVGREDGLRKYIPGHPQSNYRALFSYTSVPSGYLSNSNDAIPLEFAFDIYRTTKGDENKGVLVTFDVLTHQWDPAKEADYIKEVSEAKLAFPRPESKTQWAKANELAEKYGRFSYNKFEIYDYHTSAIYVPTGLFKNANQGTVSESNGLQIPGLQPVRFQIQVKCETPSQFIGATRYDMYLLESEGNFALNYFKGAIGVWCRCVLAIGIGIAISTYLAGVLSFLTTLGLLIAGFFQEFLFEVAFGKATGGGPLESLTRLVKNTTAAGELDQTPTVQVLLFLDQGFGWIFRRVLDVIPDTDRFGLSDYVAQGFNIGFEVIFLNVVFLAAYMLPWMLAAYYFMKGREIAA
jgi:hypothetical protein